MDEKDVIKVEEQETTTSSAKITAEEKKTRTRKASTANNPATTYGGNAPKSSEAADGEAEATQRKPRKRKTQATDIPKTQKDDAQLSLPISVATTEGVETVVKKPRKRKTQAADIPGAQAAGENTPAEAQKDSSEAYVDTVKTSEAVSESLTLSDATTIISDASNTNEAQIAEVSSDTESEAIADETQDELLSSDSITNPDIQTEETEKDDEKSESQNSAYTDGSENDVGYSPLISADGFQTEFDFDSEENSVFDNESVALPEKESIENESEDSLGDETEDEFYEKDDEEDCSLDKYNPEKPRNIDKRFDIIELFVFTLLAVMILTSFVFRHSIVEGPSMENTLYSGDHLIISDLFYTPKRGDVIVCEDYTTAIKKPIVKRVIAVENDRIRITEDQEIYVNDVLLDESDYVFIDDPDFLYTPFDEFTVPEGELFVMGDHRNDSSDSRIIGTVSEDSVLGKVLIRFYPFNKFSVIE